MTSWVSLPEGGLRFQSWEEDDLAVVYDAATGDTHLLDLSSLLLLRSIQISARTTESLAIELAEYFANEDAGDVFDFVELTLQQLSDIGLVTSTSP